MNGLLKKELLILKMNLKGYILLVVIFAAVSFLSSASYFSSMIMMYSMLMPISSFSADEMARWDGFATALPGGRRAVVKAKYQYLLVVFTILTILLAAVNLLIYAFGRADRYTLPELLAESLIYVLVGLVLNSIFLPLMFKYGSQKGRIALAVVVGVICAAAAMGMMILFMGNQSLVLFVGELIPQVPAAVVFALLAGLSAAALIVSYRISQRIYAKKEF